MGETNNVEEKIFKSEIEKTHEIEMDYFWNGIFLGLIIGVIIFAVIFHICQGLSS